MEVLYYKLRCPEVVDPLHLATEIFQWVESDKLTKSGTDSLLLCLSIIRKLICEFESFPHQSGQRKGSTQEVTADCGYHLINLLLQRHSFLQQMVHYLQSQDQLVSYLAGKVLSLVLQHSQCSAEVWLPRLAPILTFPKHEPLYALQVMKSCIKMAAKSGIDLSDPSTRPSPVTPTLWHECKSALASRLSEDYSSEWPKLNFTLFLEICSKLIPYREFELLITRHLHELIDLVNKHCHHLDTLRQLVKLSLKVVRKLQSFEDEAMGIVDKAAWGLLESAHLHKVVRGVVSQISLECEGDGELNVKRSIVRNLIILLMTLMSLQISDDGVAHLEKMVSKFFQQCGWELSDDLSVIELARHHIVQLMCDQDTALVDMMVVSLALWRKRPMWSHHFSLHCCFSFTCLHSILAEFLHTVCYDHSILLDFLISSETSNFEGFLQEFAATCVQDWGSVQQAWDDTCEQSTEEYTGEVTQDTKSESEMARGKHPEELVHCEGEAAAAIPELLATDEQPYCETTLDKIMNCFIKLKFSLTRLQAHKLLPFKSELLVAQLQLMEDLYEN